MRRMIFLVRFFFGLTLVLVLGSCSTTKESTEGGEDVHAEYAVKSSADGSANEQGQGKVEHQAGLVTAGEWSDLQQWNFWKTLIEKEGFKTHLSHWGIFPQNRISVLLKSSGKVVQNAKVELVKNNQLVWVARTDNFGYAELWIGLFEKESQFNISDFSLKINNIPITNTLHLYEQGVNEINVTQANGSSQNVEIAFVVDATGSMGDELEFLKADLKNVIDKVKQENSSLHIATSAVFYRDEGDDYVVRKSDFSSDLQQTIAFINKQSANGGGDFPEAVHTALKTTLDDLQWSDSSKTRIAFLILDAPPHHNPQVLESLRQSVRKFAEKGIKLIPITASGIDKQTEFLMRMTAMLTNGTYVFITNHSGIGNPHLEATVGDYQVEKLNDLMVRLIKKYSE